MKIPRPAWHRLRRQLTRLRRLAESLEDLRTLNEAIARNGGKPGIPWAQVKAELGL